MSSSHRFSPETDMPQANLEDRLRQASAALPYPPTPNLAAHERQRLAKPEDFTPSWRTHWRVVGLALLMIFVVTALLVSPVRARVLDWLRIGAVRIFFTLPTPTATQPHLSGTPSPAVTQTPAPTPTFLSSVLDLGGETTLSKAQAQAGFTIKSPAYPPDLGRPEHVFLQNFNGPVVVLVWMDQSQSEKVRMSLSESASNQIIFEKYAPQSVQDTQVGGQAAVWVDGEYLLLMRNGDMTMTRLITQGHTLIWTAGSMTFRLETDVDLETAIRIAESIR